MGVAVGLLDEAAFILGIRVQVLEDLDVQREDLGDGGVPGDQWDRWGLPLSGHADGKCLERAKEMLHFLQKLQVGLIQRQLRQPAAIACFVVGKLHRQQSLGHLVGQVPAQHLVGNQRQVLFLSQGEEALVEVESLGVFAGGLVVCGRCT